MIVTKVEMDILMGLDPLTATAEEMARMEESTGVPGLEPASSPQVMKYAVLETERKFLVASLPEGEHESRLIVDRYVVGTRLRLREVTHPDGTVEHKLTQKIRMGEGPGDAVACSTLYLSPAEWRLMVQSMPVRTLVKTRHLYVRDGLTVAIDEIGSGVLLAEIDGGDTRPEEVPDWLDVVLEVGDDEAWAGVWLAE